MNSSEPIAQSAARMPRSRIPTTQFAACGISYLCVYIARVRDSMAIAPKQATASRRSFGERGAHASAPHNLVRVSLAQSSRGTDNPDR